MLDFGKDIFLSINIMLLYWLLSTAPEKSAPNLR